jgi:hypothetical protein
VKNWKRIKVDTGEHLCRVCGAILVVPDNWTATNKKKYIYYCRKCATKVNAENQKKRRARIAAMSDQEWLHTFYPHSDDSTVKMGKVRKWVEPKPKPKSDYLSKIVIGNQRKLIATKARSEEEAREIIMKIYGDTCEIESMVRRGSTGGKAI